jgi:hypothetical protein
MKEMKNRKTQQGNKSTVQATALKNVQNNKIMAEERSREQR